ncbi:hypothetical protein OG407_24770 [Streptomyces sp. NBC_01515]|uniref:hypothetical protein n=1 Tax=Streptomyces sp. NBC_01515 TaxID=2903890 RepID=UPI003862F5C3
MSVDAIVHTEFPKGYTVLFGADGKMLMTPQSLEHSSTIKSMQYDTIVSLGRHAKTASDVYIDFLPTRTPPPTWRSFSRTPAERASATAFEDVLRISEVVSTSSARKDYDDCTAKYGLYGIPVYLVGEAVDYWQHPRHAQPQSVSGSMSSAMPRGTD